MHCRISKAFADGFKPKPGEKPTPNEAFDTRDVGLILRAEPSGARSWYYAYRMPLSGRRGRYRMGGYPGLSVAGARALVNKLAGKVAHGINPQTERKNQRAQAQRDQVSTLKLFLARKYEPYAKLHLKTGTEQIKRIRADFKSWLDKPLCTITREMAVTWRSAELERGKRPVTVNRDLQRIHAALSKAKDEWKLIELHPFEGLKPLKTDTTGRVRYLSADEEARLRIALLDRETSLREARDTFNAWRADRHLKPLPARDGDFIDHVRPMVLTALHTGLRRGELLSLRWRHVNVEGKTLEVEGTSAKTGQTRHVPLDTETLELLIGWRNHCKGNDVDYVFARNGERMNNVKHAWSTIVKLAALDTFRFHDLRHHFASRLVMAGQPLNTVRELLGHTTLEMTLKYAHLAPGNLRAAIDAVDPRKIGSTSQ